MILWRLVTCLVIAAFARGREVKLFRNVTSSPEGWTQYITNGTVVENATVRLVCKPSETSALVRYLRSAFVDNPLLVDIKGSSSPLKDEMLHQADDSVLIKEFGKRHEGIWECTAEYRNAQDERVSVAGPRVEIYLAVAPGISVFIAPNVNESDSVTITCGSPKAKPVPTYMAIFRNLRILNNVSYQVNVSYTILGVKKSDAGEYRCEGMNKAGKGSRTKNLIVQYVPVTTIVNGNGPIQVKQSQNVTLACRSVGVPEPAIAWLRNGGLLKSENNTLEITSASKIHTGNYTCVGRNDAGVHTDTIELQVQVPPEPPHQLRAKTKTNVSITLSWTPGSDNFSPISGYKVSFRRNGTSCWRTAKNFSDSTVTTQLVEGLMPLTSYEFKVKAKNDIGKGEYSEVETLTTHPNAPSVGPTNLEIKQVNPESVHLTWTLANNSLLTKNEGTITYYEMAYVVTTDGGSDSQYTTDVVSEGMLTGLKKGTAYSVTVYARNSGIYRSPPSNTKGFETSRTIPGAVHLKVTLKSEDSLSVTWEEPKDDGGDEITRYFVKYRKSASQQYHEVSMGPTDRSAVFEDLTPSTQYIISVRAANSRGNGTSNSTSSTTLDKAVPVSTQNVTETTITLNIIIDDVVDRFVVEWQRDGAAPEELDLEGMKRSVVILSLQPNTLYTITVTAHLPGGQERTSEVKEWTKRLTGIKIDPPTVNLESGMETEVSCLTRLGAEPPTVEWLQENKTVSTTEFVTVNDHALTLKYSTELNGAEFECQVNEFRESLEVFIVPPEPPHQLYSESDHAWIWIVTAIAVVEAVVIVVIIVIVCVRSRKTQHYEAVTVAKISARTEMKEQSDSATAAVYELVEEVRHQPGETLTESPLYQPQGTVETNLSHGN